MGKFFFVQKHRPSAGLARVIHQKDQRLLKNFLQMLRQRNAPAPFGILGVIAQITACIIHNAGNGQSYAVELFCRQRVFVQVRLNTAFQICKGSFRVMIQPMLQPRYRKNFRSNEIRQRQRNSVRPHGDGENLSFIRKLKIFGTSSAVSVVACIPRRFQNAPLAKILKRPHGRGLADTSHGMDRGNGLLFAVHKGFQNSLPVDQLDIRRYGNFINRNFGRHHFILRHSFPHHSFNIQHSS